MIDAGSLDGQRKRLVQSDGSRSKSFLHVLSQASHLGSFSSCDLCNSAGSFIWLQTLERKASGTVSVSGSVRLCLYLATCG
jgi:hypothetical protein